MDHRSKCKKERYKLLKDNKGDNLDDFGFGNDFLDIRIKTERRQQKLPVREGSDVRLRKYFEITIINYSRK